MTAATKLLAALDGFRDALAVYIADRAAEPATLAPILTIAHAARVLGVSRSTATRWAGSGELPTVVIDGRRWVRRADLDRVAGSKS